MAITSAYLGLILIWTTTPLGIKWSGEDAGFLFGVTGRMLISLLLALLLVFLLRHPLPWHRQARKTYLAAGLGIYFAMISVYWAAQSLPSGWISVLYGLTPLITAVFASRLLGEQVFSLSKLLGMLLGVSGLVVIFAQGLSMSDAVLPALSVLLFSVISHAASAVMVKRLDPGLPGLVITSGGLLIAVPLFLLTWLLTGEPAPQSVGFRTGAAILYLGVVGSVVGFALYYYVLKNLAATRVALITLITPVSALLLGIWLNDEQVTASIIAGTALILGGLFSFEYGDRVRAVVIADRVKQYGSQ